jgi:hypothetical protein
MKYDTVPITMQTLNIYEINNSVEFSQNNFNDYNLHSRLGHLKLVCEIIMEQEVLRGGDFFSERKISTFRADIENKIL